MIGETVDGMGILIGIAGGTGSGKTLVSNTILRTLNSDRILAFQQDAYYRDLSHLDFEKRCQQNFDHPDAFDRELLLSHLTDLKNGKPIEQPQYDFATHSRRKEYVTIHPQPIIILEGILILADADLRALMDIKVFVDADADIRLIRRLRRDIRDRGRSIESVLEQYQKFVRPMHREYVEPSKHYADIIIPEGGKNMVAVDLLVTKIRSLLAERDLHIDLDIDSRYEFIND
jgi:uridine kinase